MGVGAGVAVGAGADVGTGVGVGVGVGTGVSVAVGGGTGAGVGIGVGTGVSVAVGGGTGVGVGVGVGTGVGVAVEGGEVETGDGNGLGVGIGVSVGVAVTTTVIGGGSVGGAPASQAKQTAERPQTSRKSKRGILKAVLLGERDGLSPPTVSGAAGKRKNDMSSSPEWWMQLKGRPFASPMDIGAARATLDRDGGGLR